MKSRIGFVSNSSTSSFCIYGTCLGSGENELDPVARLKDIQKKAFDWVRNTKQTYEQRCRNILKEVLNWSENS